jgi:hypothetical protein
MMMCLTCSENPRKIAFSNANPSKPDHALTRRCKKIKHGYFRCCLACSFSVVGVFDKVFTMSRSRLFNQRYPILATILELTKKQALTNPLAVG